jgi:hypothetical protein
LNLVIAFTGCGAVLLVVPAVAGACPSLANVKSFHGTASATFDQTATSSDGTASITLDRVATGIQFPSLTPQVLGGVLRFTGGPRGGSISVNDSYDNRNVGIIGAQTASGPTLPYPQAGKAVLAQTPGTCDYEVVFSFAIATTSTGEWPYGPGQLDPDLGVTGTAASPAVSIPSDLKLSGTATVPWEGQPGTGQGLYQASGLPPHNPGAWVQTFDGLLNLSGETPGMATISWNFLPTTGPPSSCNAGGGTTAAADQSGSPLAATAQRNPPTSIPDLAAFCKKLKVVALKTVSFWAKVQSITGYAAAAAAGIYGAITGDASAVAAAGIGGAVASAYGGISALAEKYASDPPDPNWRAIVKPHPIRPAAVSPNAWLTPNAAVALNGIFEQTAIVNGLERAAGVSSNRAGSARNAHSAVWVKRQTQALGHYAIRAGEAIARLVTLIQQSQPTLSVPFPGLTPADLKRAEDYVRRHGLPASFVRLAKRYGVPASTLAAVKKRLNAGAGLPSYATSIYGLVSYPPLITAEHKAANALQTYGHLLLATS